MIQQERLFDLTFNPVSMDEAAKTLIGDAKNNFIRTVVTPNVEHVVKAKKDALLRDLLNGFSYQFVDGMPLVWMSRWLCKKPFPERVSGVDLFQQCCAMSVEQQVSIFLLGSTELILEQTVLKLHEEYPGINIVGYHSPSFSCDDNENAKLINRLNESDAQLVFVALGTPKQEFWIAQNIEQLNQGVLVGIGAAFDIYSGKFPRSPGWMQKLGLEWVWRLLLEPKRLWRRYLNNFMIIPFFLRIFFCR